MNEDKIKTKYDAFRAQIIKDLIAETGYSQSFVREAIKGQQKSISADKVRKNFNNRYAKLKEALKSI